MKYLFALWAAPLVLFWSWFYLSLHDMNFGFIILTRQVHDLVFQLYGNILGIDPAIIPPMVARACVFDGFVLGASGHSVAAASCRPGAAPTTRRYFATNSEPNA